MATIEEVSVIVTQDNSDPYNLMLNITIGPETYYLPKEYVLDRIRGYGVNHVDLLLNLIAIRIVKAGISPSNLAAIKTAVENTPFDMVIP